MATATEAPKTIEERLAALASQGANLKESVDSITKTLNEPHRMHAGEGVAGWWETGEETIYASVPQGGPRFLPKHLKRLPRGYKQAHWKCLGDFLADGYKSHAAQNAGEFTKKFGEVRDSLYKAVQGMSVQQGESAGFFVLPEFNMNVMGRTYENDIWGRTDQYTVNNNMVFLANAETSRATGSRHGGMRGYWVDEAASMTKSKPTFRKIELSLKKVAVLVYLTEELINDGGPVLEQYVSKKANEEFAFLLGDSVFNGYGGAMPLGILNSPALLSITKETGQAASSIVMENIDKMDARRFVGGDYAWFHNQDCTTQLDQLSQAVGTGGVVLNRQEGAQGRIAKLLKSMPRNETEFNATLGTQGDIALADLKQYLSISKGGVAQAVSTELEFLTDQVAIKFTMRVNGRPWETTPVTPFKGSNTQASFLVIDTRA